MNAFASPGSLISGYHRAGAPWHTSAGDNPRHSVNTPERTAGFASASLLRISAMDVFERSVLRFGGSAQPQPDMTAMPVPNPPAFARTAPISAESAARNILNSVTLRLQRDISNGADSESLQSRLTAGREGFEKGFGQAVEDLKDLGMLSDEVQAEIDKTYAMVTAGLDVLGEQIANGEALDFSSVFAADESAAPVTAGTAVQTVQTVQQSESRSFSLQLTTLDGDVVTVNVAQAAMRAMTREQSADGTATSGVSMNSKGFEFSVEGNLDEAEFGAISDLMSQLKELSSSFFAGDMGTALAQAQALTYNNSEIAGFDLNLQHSRAQRVQSAYSQTAATLPDSPAASSEPTSLLQFGRKLEEAFAVASNFESPAILLERASSLFDREGSRAFSSLVAQLLAVRNLQA